MEEESNNVPFTHILKTIELIRDSFTGSEIVYMNGSCVKFCMILLHIYPKGKIFYDLNHAIFEYEGKFYDINGFAKKENHTELQDYGLLKSFTSMNLIYKKESDYPKVITRLVRTIEKYWGLKNKEKALFYTNRLKSVLESVV